MAIVFAGRSLVANMLLMKVGVMKRCSTMRASVCFEDEEHLVSVYGAEPSPQDVATLTVCLSHPCRLSSDGKE